MIHVYNTLTKTKEKFQTLQPGKVGMYLCGPTVYKPSHIGHMVGPVIFDAITRYLKYNDYEVRFIVNITDVDDKLIAESTARNTTMAALADEMTADYKANLTALEIDTITEFPKATEHIHNIIAFIEKLIAKDFAYPADGDVYFDVSRFAEYGKLSGRSPDQMQGEGGLTASQKRNATDFALWKAAKPGEPSWESPWGPGRPGWHIECSVMSHVLLGDTFEIHGGGLDLIFPHHENEIAQSECCTGKPYVKYWMHNGLMQASSELGKLGGRNTREAEAGNLASQEDGKISKSKGANAFRDMLNEFSGEAIRFFVLSTHYRRPIDFSNERIRQVETGLETFYRFFKRFHRVTRQSFYSLEFPHQRGQGNEFAAAFTDPFLDWVSNKRTDFLTAMDDDFNTGAAIGELFELVRHLNRFIDEQKLETADKDPTTITKLIDGTRTLRELASTLGLFRQEIVRPGAAESDSLVNELMALLIELRANAKKAKDFATADAIRNRLKDLGVTLEDRPGGTEWCKS